MTDIQQPRRTYEESAAHGRERYGMHPLLKVVIGCGAAVLIVLVVLVGIAVYAGYQIQKDMGGAKAHEEANRTFERLASEHPFTPPADGVVSEGQALLFFEVTDEVWREIDPIVQEMNDLGKEVEDQESKFGIGNVLAGMRDIGKLMRARLVLAASLEQHGAPLDQYIWTGNSLIDAYDALSQPDSADVPEANLELARQHSEELAAFASEHEFFDKSVILMVAGITDPSQGLWEIQPKETSPE